eukprot:1181229-Prorocentrum_minimum.AAC.5
MTWHSRMCGHVSSKGERWRSRARPLSSSTRILASGTRVYIARSNLQSEISKARSRPRETLPEHPRTQPRTHPGIGAWVLVNSSSSTGTRSRTMTRRETDEDGFESTKCHRGGGVQSQGKVKREVT